MAKVRLVDCMREMDKPILVTITLRTIELKVGLILLDSMKITVPTEMTTVIRVKGGTILIEITLLVGTVGNKAT